MPLFVPGGIQSAVEGVSSFRLGERQFVGLFDNDTNEFIGFKVGKIYPGQVGTTAYSEVPMVCVLTEGEKARLAALMTNAALVNAINAELGTNIAAILDENGQTYNGISTILNTGPSGDRWFRAAVSIYGNPADGDGDLVLPPDVLGVSDITGLVAALAGKTDDGHGHAQSQVTGLDAALANIIATTVAQSSVGVDIAELDETGKLKATQVPAGITAPVTSVHGRDGVVVAVAGDYDATEVDAPAAGVLAAGTVASQLAYLEANKAQVTAGKIDSGLLPTSTVIEKRATPIPFAAGGIATFTDCPAAFQIWNATSMSITFTTTFTKRVYIYGAHGTLGSAGTVLRPAYRTGGWSATVGNWTQLTGGDFSLAPGAATGMRKGAAITLPGGAIGDDIEFTILSGGGDGVADPTVVKCFLVFEDEIPLGPGTMTAAQIAAVLDPAYPAWRDPAGALPDASVTLAKIVNFATQTAPIRKSAGTGVLEAGSQADWRTFIDGVVSFKTRKGAVVPAAGDYDADMIDQTAARVFVTPTDLAVARRAAAVTTFTSSPVSIGFDEETVIFSGTGSPLTGPLTNGAIAKKISIFNARSDAVTLTAQAGRTLANTAGTVVASYSLAPRTGVCALLVGTVWTILA